MKDQSPQHAHGYVQLDVVLPMPHFTEVWSTEQQTHVSMEQRAITVYDAYGFAQCGWITLDQLIEMLPDVWTAPVLLKPEPRMPGHYWVEPIDPHSSFAEGRILVSQDKVHPSHTAAGSLLKTTFVPPPQAFNYFASSTLGVA